MVLTGKVAAPLRIERVVSAQACSGRRPLTWIARVWGSGCTCAAKDLPIEDDNLDTVIRAYVPEHLDDPFAGLSEMVRVPKSGGPLIVSRPAAAPPDALLRPK